LTRPRFDTWVSGARLSAFGKDEVRILTKPQGGRFDGGLNRRASETSMTGALIGNPSANGRLQVLVIKLQAQR
jgi:hypothetical protein